MNPAGWEQTPNTILRDVAAGRVSARALGVFIVLRQRQGLGSPLSSEALAADLAEGRDAIRAAYRELTAAGYLHIVTVAGGDRALTRTVHLYDEPTTAEQARADHLSGPGSQGLSADLRAGISGPENPAVKTYKPTTTTPLPPTDLRAGISGPENPALSGRHLFDPDPGGTVCTRCQLPATNGRHLPGPYAAPPLPLEPVPAAAARRRGGPTRGRGNAWSATARRRRAG